MSRGIIEERSIEGCRRGCVRTREANDEHVGCRWDRNGQGGVGRELGSGLVRLCDGEKELGI